MPNISLTTVIKANTKDVFDLARSVEIHKLSTAKTNEEAIAGKTSGLLELGDWVTWRAKHLGFYQTLTSKITAFDSPTFFVDEMQKGIFKSFRHEHHFSDKEDYCEMIDLLDYKSPFGIIGKLADYIFLKRYMTRFLSERALVIKKEAEL